MKNGSQYYDKSLAIDPNERSALNGKGDAFYRQGNYTIAIQYYDKVLAIYPNDTDALNGIGNALSSQGNYTQAIQSFDKASATQRMR